MEPCRGLYYAGLMGNQVMSKRVLDEPNEYKLGQTQALELTACLHGGNGNPAAQGITAFKRLRDHGVLGGTPKPTQAPQSIK